MRKKQLSYYLTFIFIPVFILAGCANDSGDAAQITEPDKESDMIQTENLPEDFTEQGLRELYNASNREIVYYQGKNEVSDWFLSWAIKLAIFKL